MLLAARKRSLAQLLPAKLTPPVTPPPSSPRACRSISAPVSSVVSARSAKAAAASARSAWSRATHRPRDWTRGFACMASLWISDAESSTSPNTALQLTAVSCWAPTMLSASSAVSLNWATWRRRDRAGTRTSNPADSRAGPVLDIKSHASS